MMATPRPRGDDGSGIASRSDRASKPGPVFFTLRTQRSSSTWSRTSYSSSMTAWSITLVQASLNARQMSSTHSWFTPKEPRAFFTTARMIPTVSDSWGRHTATSRSM